MNPALIPIVLLLLSDKNGSVPYINNIFSLHSPALHPPRLPKIPTRVEPFQLEMMVDKLRDTAESLDKLKYMGNLRTTLPTMLPTVLPTVLPLLLGASSNEIERHGGSSPENQGKPLDAVRDYLADHKESSDHKTPSSQLSDMMAALAPMLSTLANSNR